MLVNKNTKENRNENKNFIEEITVSYTHLDVYKRQTNHSYLDNLTFRGMRQSLMNTFNEIYLLD